MRGRKSGETGLALTTSKEIVELMGGKIGAISKVGEGATFWFSLSFESSDRNPLQGKQKNIEEDKETAKILLVEDNPVNQMVIKALLKKIGYHIDIANDGQKAIEQLQQKRYDLVLMDLQMPIIDGLEATRYIRANPLTILNNTLPIIAVTANAREGCRDKCIDAGMDDYMTKPVSREEMGAMLRKWLKKAELG